MVSQPHREGVAALLTTPGVEQAVPGDPEQPGTLIHPVDRRLVEPSPGHQEGVGRGVLSLRRVNPTTHEAQHVGIGVAVEQPEPGFSVWFLGGHIRYLSG